MKKVLKQEVRICVCGCDKTFNCVTTSTKRFIQGHNRQGKHIMQPVTKLCACGCGTPFVVKYPSEMNRLYFNIYHANGDKKPLSEERRIARHAKMKKIVPWNKGLTKYTDARLMNNSKNRVGKGNPMYGKPLSDEHKAKMSKSLTGIKRSSETISKMSKAASERVLAGHSNHAFYKNGHIKLIRFDKAFYYRSSYERQALLLLNSLADVISISCEAISVKYVDDKNISHYYIPDFLVTTEDGKVHIIEVKPSCFITDRINQIKFKACEQYAKEHNMSFSVWTEKLLFCENSVTTTFPSDLSWTDIFLRATSGNTAAYPMGRRYSLDSAAM